MSGFFALHREVPEHAVRNLSSVGFKINDQEAET
jgi:hypothetical protein